MHKRRFLALGLSFLLVAALVLAACGPAPVVEEPVVEEPVVEEPVVEEPVVEEPVVEEPVVEEPVVEEEEVEVLGFPRSETLFAQQLTERNATPSNFNMWAGWRQRDRGMQQLMNEPLWVDSFETGEIINALTTGPPSYSEDFTQMTIRLREGVYWSDGVEVTADDVVFTVDFIKATPGAGYNATVAPQVKSVYTADRYTAVIEFIEPNPRFHFVVFGDLWGSLWIMPKHVFQQFVLEWEPMTVDTEAFFAFEYNPPLSTGPYVLHSYDPAGFWTAWERRDDWERTPTGMLFGKPAPRFVVFSHYGDFTARVIAQVRHEVDMVDLSLPAIRAAIAADPEYIRAYFADRDFPWLLAARHPGIGGAVFNTLKPPFDNREVRWALTLAIDPVSYMMTAYDGAAALNPFHIVLNAPQLIEPYTKPIVAWLEEDFTLDIGDGETFKPWDPDAAYRLVEEAWKRGFEFPDDPELIRATFGWGAWKYAPDVAARLLENNGFSRDEDGKWLLPDGTLWKFTVLTDQTPVRWGYRNAEAAYVEWRRFGIDVRFEISEAGQLRPEYGDFDVAGVGVVGNSFLASPDLFRPFANFHSDYLEPVLGERQWGHPSRWTYPRIDEILDEVQGIHPDDADQLEPLYLELIKIFIEEMPTIPGTTSLDPYTVSTYYWTGWPSAENPFAIPYHHYLTFKYLLTFLEPTGR